MPVVDATSGPRKYPESRCPDGVSYSAAVYDIRHCSFTSTRLSTETAGVVDASVWTFCELSVVACTDSAGGSAVEVSTVGGVVSVVLAVFARGGTVVSGVVVAADSSAVDVAAPSTVGSGDIAELAVAGSVVDADAASTISAGVVVPNSNSVELATTCARTGCTMKPSVTNAMNTKLSPRETTILFFMRYMLANKC